jgi:hypothetical protein
VSDVSEEERSKAYGSLEFRAEKFFLFLPPYANPEESEWRIKCVSFEPVYLFRVEALMEVLRT